MSQAGVAVEFLNDFLGDLEARLGLRFERGEGGSAGCSYEGAFDVVLVPGPFDVITVDCLIATCDWPLPDGFAPFLLLANAFHQFGTVSFFGVDAERGRITKSAAFVVDRSKNLAAFQRGLDLLLADAKAAKPIVEDLLTRVRADRTAAAAPAAAPAADAFAFLQGRV